MNTLSETKRNKIIQIWNEDIHCYDGKNSYYNAIRECFLDESLPFPKKQAFKEGYHYHYIIENMMRTSPERMISFILDRNSFSFFTEATLMPLLKHSAYIASELSVKDIKNILSSSGNFIKARFIEKLLAHNKDKYTELFIEFADEHIKNLDQVDHIDKDEESLINMPVFYYEGLKDLMSAEQLQNYAPKMLEAFIGKIEKTEYNHYANHEPQGIYFLTQLADFLNDEAYFERVDRYFKENSSFEHCMALIQEKLPEKEEYFIKQLFSRGANTVKEPNKHIFNALEKYDFESYFDQAFKYLDNGAYNFSSITRACQVLHKYPSLFLDKISQNLEQANSSSDERLKAMRYLIKINSEQSFNLLAEILEKEFAGLTDISFKNELAQYLDKESGLKGVKYNINSLRKTGKLEKWHLSFNEYDLPPIYLNNSEILSIVEIRYMFLNYRSILSLNLSSLIKYLDRDKNSQLFDFLMDNLQENDNSCFFIACLCLNESNFEQYKQLFITSCKEDTYNYPLQAGLMIYATDQALSLVYKYLPDETSLFEELAEAKGIEVKELYDRCSSRFTFNGLSKTFSHQDKHYQVLLSKNFELHYFDQQMQRLEKEPSITSELQDELDDLKESINTSKAKTEKDFFKNMLTGSSWSVAAFKNNYFKSPIGCRCATLAVFSLMNKNEAVSFFYINDNLDFIDIDNNLINLEDHALIHITHPSELNESEISSFKEKFLSLGLANFSWQLDRTVFRLQENEKLNFGVDRYNENIAINSTEAARQILKNNDYITYSSDDGYLEYTIDPQENIEVMLGVEGMTNHHYCDDEEVTFIDTVFKDTSSFPDVNMRLADVPKAIISEAIRVLEEIAHTEYDGEYDEDDEDEDGY